MTIRVLIILFLGLNSFVHSQTIHSPENYKIADLNYVNDDFKTDNFLSNSVIVIPNKSATPISNFITDILLNGDTVWFATGRGLMRTIDNFHSFEYYTGLEPFGDDDIAGFTLNKRFLVATTAISEEINNESVATGTGVKISTDYGLNWSSVPQPIDGRGDSLIVYGSNNLYALPVVVRQQNLAYDVAITKTQNDTANATIWICSFAGGLRKSTDYGITWIRVVLPPDNLDSININTTGYTFVVNPLTNLNQRVFSIATPNDSTLYVGSAGGINMSSNYGVNWRKYNYNNTGRGSGISGNFVVSLDIQRFNGKEIIWGATNNTGEAGDFDAFSYSSNGGANWSNTLERTKTNGMSFKDSIVYGFTNNGLWRAIYGTFNWSKAPLIFDDSTKDRLKTQSFYCGNNIGDTIYFGSADGLIRTIEYGQPWIGKWKIYRAVTPIDLSSGLKTYAAPNPFSPDDEFTRFYYKSTKQTSRVTIKIFDFGMNPVRTLIQNATRTGTDVLYTVWDGSNDQGSQVANGVYFYRVELDDDDAVWGKIILLQ
ncbi:MAG: FlgD immunoglobulin-like domain containing protein [bacterium]